MPAPTLSIGIDYDGTIADTNRMKSAWISAHLGLDVPPWQCDRSHCVPLIGRDNYRAMSATVYGEDGSRRAAAVPGAIEAIQLLRAQAEVFVVTARKPDRVPFASSWLDEHGLTGDITAILSSAGTTKQAICTAHGIAVLVDDDPRHLLDPGPPLARAIWLRAGADRPAAVPAGVEFFGSWPELLAHF